MLAFLLLAASCLVLAAVAVLWRRRAHTRRATRAMLQRLEHRYIAANAPAKTVPLRSPAGRVAVGPDGVLVSLDGDEFRCVGWKDIGEVQTSRGGAMVLHIVHVGDIAVPRALGRDIWDAVSDRSAAHV